MSSRRPAITAGRGHRSRVSLRCDRRRRGRRCRRIGAGPPGLRDGLRPSLRRGRAPFPAFRLSLRGKAVRVPLRGGGAPGRRPAGRRGRSASPSRTGTSPSRVDVGLPARDCWIGSDLPGRVSGMCTSQPSAMPALGIGIRRSLPSTALRPGSASALRWLWCNRKRASDMRNRRSAHGSVASVHEHPDVGCARPDRHREAWKTIPSHGAAPEDRHAPPRKADGIGSGSILASSRRP